MSPAGSSCPSCGSGPISIFHHQPRVPANSCLLLESREEACSFPQGSLRLGFCPACGFISNTDFDPSLSEYSTRYEETQAFSPRFRAFARELAERWISKYDIRNKDLLEIGCGKADFLVLMCELGNNRGWGVDPSAIPERVESEAAERITFIQDFYSERYADLPADVVVCRHTLEHLPFTAEFMGTVRQAIGDRVGTVVLFELPDVLRVLREVAFWDVYYEHCSYFSLGSLARLFRRTGFEVLDLALDYDDQYLLIEARPSPLPVRQSPLSVEDDLSLLTRGVEHFRTGVASAVATWRRRIETVVVGGGRAVIWGAGSKGVAFLTTTGMVDEIEYAVDVNPYKQGMYLAGTGQRIVAPEFLKTYRPQLVVVMNEVYRGEIQDELEAMGVDAELTSV